MIDTVEVCPHPSIVGVDELSIRLRPDFFGSICHRRIPEPPANEGRKPLTFIELVVFGVFRALQGQLKGEPLLGDLIYPHTRRYCGRSGVRSARFAGFRSQVTLGNRNPPDATMLISRTGG